MTITAAIEKLTSRFRQRTTTALEQIEAAAKTLAAGGTVDMGGLESALVTAQMGPDDFAARCEFHGERAAKLAALERLGPARTKADKIDKEIASENAKHAELTSAYQKRWSALREQANEAGREVEECRSCREWLLDPKNAPLNLRGEYDAALAGEQEAHKRISDIERTLRDLRERHKSAIGWIEQLTAEDVRTLHPSSIAKSQRDKLTAAQREKVEEHERRRDRLAKQITESEAEMETARLELVKVEATLANVRKRILAA